MSERRSRLAVVALVLGVLGLLDLGLGPILAQRDWVAPMTGFGIFQLGLLGGLLALILGVVSVFRTRAGSGRSGRPHALGAILCGLVALGIVGGAAGPGVSVPPINDITTDPGDPPLFQAAQNHAPNQGRDLAYPAEFADQQRPAYPDLAPIELAVPPAEALERARETAVSLGWEIVEVREASGELEAYERTALFHFVDDVIVRVRAREGGSLVDVRSKSRDGRGDLGANAARIRKFRDALAAGG